MSRMSTQGKRGVMMFKSKLTQLHRLLKPDRPNLVQVVAEWTIWPMWTMFI